MSDPKDWTAKQWAEWAAGFLPDGAEYIKGGLDPLHDLNHLGLILDEIERRSSGWEFYMNNPALGVYEFGITMSDGAFHNADADTRNLAVLLAAKALEDSE